MDPWRRSIEAGGATYQWDGRAVNAGGVTTLQRHAVVSENRLTQLPDDLPMDIAVLLGCAAPTGMGAAFNVFGCALENRSRCSAPAASD